MTARIAWLTLGACCLSPLRAAPQPVDGRYLHGNGHFTIAIDAGTGALVEIRFDGRTVAAGATSEVPFDIRDDDGWVVGGRHTRFTVEAVEIQGDDLVTSLKGGDWRVRCHYRIHPREALLTRSAELLWEGRKPTKLRGFWFRSPTFAVDQTGYYFFPGQYPPSRRRAAEFQPDSKRSYNRSVAPLVAQLGAGSSGLWLSDELTAGSDRPSIGVTERAGGFWTGQGFDARGHMPPGSAQRVGDACLWLLGADGETALMRIHDWMAARGQVVPADRPDWFQDAVIYSFHPGGTIGSQFKDLGGFVPATAFLERIAALGCNTIWLLPLEDRSPYWPRDYYRFQDGLGTAEQYRTLVARAHGLGLKVLQDIVPHGGSNTFQRAIEHPDWLVQKEDGSTLFYWCFDFNHPAWREYMAGVARHYVSAYDIDGYRVDACGGSKIANWNPGVPYARASHALLQGGLNMLRSIRAAVKAEKPHIGGLLAEVQGSVFGTVSDAVYDFDLCYRVLPDARRQTPEVFVERLRRWLHEQQYAETRGLLRLRHIESHDSLRSALWYGTEGQRALLALTAWIRGIPLVYHEMENGSSAEFRRIFELREALPELRRGDADYLCVEAPPGVFACLRWTTEQASIAVIDFGASRPSSEPSRLGVPLDALPDALRANVTVWRAGARKPLGDVAAEGGRLILPIERRELSYTLFALRPARAATPLPEPSRSTTAPVTRNVAASENAIPVGGEACRVWVDRATGLPAGIAVNGSMVWGRADLFLPPDQLASARSVVVRRDGAATVAERSFGEARLRLSYRPTAGRVGIELRWLGPAPGYGALYLPALDARSWAAGAERDDYRVRHVTTDGLFGSIYWRAQGANVLWDSLLHPAWSATGTLAAETAHGAGFVVLRTDATLPARVQWLDRIGDRHELGCLLAWQDPEAPVDPGRNGFAVEVTGAKPPPPVVAAAGPRLTPCLGGWRVENDQYRLELSRSGVIRRLWAKQPRLRLVVDGGDVYTDNGYGSGRTRYGASNDVEAAARFERAGNRLHLRFEGQVRGSYRFDLLRPPVRYRCDYTFDEGPTFRLTAAVQPDASPRGQQAFLALYTPLPELGEVRYVRGGQEFASAAIGDGRRRVLQTIGRADLEPPDTILLSAADGLLLTLSEVVSGGQPLRNVFAHGEQFFLCWQDGEAQAGGARRWSWLTALWTPGQGQPETTGTLPRFGDTPPGELLRDGGFEGAIAVQPCSLRTGALLPRPDARTAWQVPPGGSLVADRRHGGRAAALVAGRASDYRLFRQPLDVQRFPEGSRWRLTAWVKGEDIVRGDIAWQVGTVRFAVTTDRTTYAACPALLGTFDWREVSAELTVPDGLRQLAVEAGQNGSTGRIWIDDISLERVE